MDLKKQGAKNRVIAIQKEKRQPIFFTLLFSGPYFGPIFFQVLKPTHVFKIKIVSAD